MTPQRTRPVGVVLSAVVLGILAFFILVGAAFSAFTALIAGHLPAAALSNPEATPTPTGPITAIMLVFAFIEVAIAAWATATLVGLVRLKPWARISVMILGGLLAFFGIVSAFGTIAISFFANTIPLPANANPAALHALFLFVGAVWLLIGAVGVWWLVYFALRPTREAFTAPSLHPANYPPAYYPPPPPPYDPLDFSIAQPIPPPAPEPVPVPYEYAPQLPPAAPKRPVSMTVIAVFLFISAFVMLIYALLPLPAFMFGTLMTGWPAHLTNFVYAAMCLIAGIGLLKLQKPAWFLTQAIYALGLINTLISLFPVPRARMMEYSQSLSRSFSLGLPTYQPNPEFANISLMFGAFCAFIMWAVFFVLLWRARWAFKPHPTQQP